MVLPLFLKLIVFVLLSTMSTYTFSPQEEGMPKYFSAFDFHQFIFVSREIIELFGLEAIIYWKFGRSSIPTPMVDL